ncbi:YybH family protein [Nocardia sp. NPDC051570]|uniref:YybH family protein n=1 Tax=Nocardia sp. NPDC051570 TaxID=3364324 RepID=UPI0037A4A184
MVFSYFAAFGAADLDAILSYHADEAAYLPAGLPTVPGKEANADVYRQTLASIRILPGARSTAEDVIGIGGFAWVRTDSHADVVDLSTGEQSAQRIREIVLLRNSSQSWKIWRYMFNTVDGNENRPTPLRDGAPAWECAGGGVAAYVDIACTAA